MRNLRQDTLPLFQSLTADSTTEIEAPYINDNKTSTTARRELEEKYRSLLTPTNKFNRKLVSYQANKTMQVHSWLKYKEGFSAQLVEIFLDEFGIESGQKILDPFAGSATTLLVAQDRGIDALGIEILPVCHLAWLAKSNYQEYDLKELGRVRQWLQETTPGQNEYGFQHITITESAFPLEQELRLNWYIEQFDQMNVNDLTRPLLRFLLMSVLEDISYTRKDGQYLRWDSRSTKAHGRDERRIIQGKSPYKKFDKGRITDIKEALLQGLDRIILDVKYLEEVRGDRSVQELIKDTTLEVLPKLASEQFDAVITSPPYCNRYDYTRTYALELAFLRVGEEGVKNLRQQLLSCTVENRSKLKQLEAFYTSIGRQNDWHMVVQAIQGNAALQEVFASLHARGNLGELNNKGVITMVEGYFTELAFVIFELARVSKKGAHIAIVNDNVRYGGEMIPVDLLMTDLAESFGFDGKCVYVLPQKKGNSSQQMGKYGREANRKSITVWKKR